MSDILVSIVGAKVPARAEVVNDAAGRFAGAGAPGLSSLPPPPAGCYLKCGGSS
ncbi:hypothetical protein [Bradyrhizobium sp. DOA9]|uniref:hypothetical protein n=1 Tax=Bradyrhizobium sp. DOA9 TaxID=1126627 RepID=UPI000AE395D5|nr:hypothetical protein [Bradyrhizobium sp. DOA9]